MIRIGGYLMGTLNAITLWGRRAWVWWLAAFGTSDTLDRPDASTLAARAAGHSLVGAVSVQIVHGGLGVPVVVTLATLGALYAAWEFWQWWRDPARCLRRVARRWDIAVDWSAVMLGGGGVAAMAAQLGGLAALIGAGAVALALVSAAIMAGT